eukprot:TRINITY_DN3885_c0_g2_i1.p2 TRINITY_DN3885_c0_g2~~TRINITY_DN3885_c0_g2_i1.p2  ORF type:complete len:121 (+),score=41.59 TRINITY_DN3885_c0_g2_i1:205-567(+)
MAMQSGASSSASGVDNTFRRKWDKEEAESRARERERDEEESERFPKSRAPPVQRKPLKQRDYEVDLTSRVGTTQIVTQVMPVNQQQQKGGQEEESGQEENEMDPDMAALMGFGGFGSSKK